MFSVIWVQMICYAINPEPKGNVLVEQSRTVEFEIVILLEFSEIFATAFFQSV